jgi:eukaryotic-like serine/threonine-protein kinase
MLCRLSTGGMSEIYLAHQSGIGGFRKLVVLKSILPDIGGQEDFVRMFLDEARTTAGFNHPNIAHVFELDVDDGMLFMAMEFVQGCTLVEMARACRQAKEPIPIGFTLSAVRDTALALHYAHNFVDARGRRQLVIHRDVAEKNIMVTFEGVTKLLDFGIAKATDRTGHTSVGMVKGTSGYMSPEQIRGEPLDGRSDIFSLGVVLHECLTGMRLFHGKNSDDAMTAALRQQVSVPSRQNPLVSPEIDALTMRALHREKSARFPSALEFAREIEKAAPGILWHPEQTAELVTKHFTTRREEIRELLDSASVMGEATGEIGVQAVMAKVRNAPESKNAPADAVGGRGAAALRSHASPRPQPAPAIRTPLPRSARTPPAPIKPLMVTAPAPAKSDDVEADIKTRRADEAFEGLSGLRSNYASRDFSKTDALRVDKDGSGEIEAQGLAELARSMAQQEDPLRVPPGRTASKPDVPKAVAQVQKPPEDFPQLMQFDDDAAGAKTAFASPQEIRAAIQAAANLPVATPAPRTEPRAEPRYQSARKVVAEEPPDEEDERGPQSSTVVWALGIAALLVMAALGTAVVFGLGPFAR